MIISGNVITVIPFFSCSEIAAAVPTTGNIFICGYVLNKRFPAMGLLCWVSCE